MNTIIIQYNGISNIPLDNGFWGLQQELQLLRKTYNVTPPW